MQDDYSGLPRTCTTAPTQDAHKITFEPAITKAELNTSGKSIHELSARLRMLFAVMHKSSSELLEAFGSESESLLELMESMGALEKELKTLSSFAGTAHSRLLLVGLEIAESIEGGES